MFRKGDTVVHPEHGAAVIEELRENPDLTTADKAAVVRGQPLVRQAPCPLGAEMIRAEGLTSRLFSD